MRALSVQRGTRGDEGIPPRMRLIVIPFILRIVVRWRRDSSWWQWRIETQ